tara:strand:+ start:1612 stop:3207 length:1596 start_codon:yes stop_codon:yes gene_type:complete
MIKKIANFFNIASSYFNQRIYLDNNEKNFIKFNKKKWKTKIESEKGIILVDLFPWYPWIYFWSYLSNIISNKHNLKIKYFYFDFYQTKGSKIRLYIQKLKKIYNSFNATEGLVEYDFSYSIEEKNIFEKKISRIKKKSDLINYRVNNLVLGDLIYDYYVRTTYEPTLKIKDIRFKKIFFRANKIFREVNQYFKENDIKIIIPSHLCYITYGIITRIALSKNITVLKLRTENRGNSSFRLMKIDKHCVDEPQYYYHKKKFKKLSNLKKKLALKIGKEILIKRTSGKFDPTLPYIKSSQFKDKKYFFKGLDKKKEKIIIFPHCFYDYPHRYRSMIFNDFYEHAIYFMKTSKSLDKYDWLYKPHPHSLSGHIDIHKHLLKKFPNIKYIPKEVSHTQLLSLNLKCVITNHGTVAHEYAAHGVPAINTGDNPHINYNFSLNVKSIKELDNVMKNLDLHLKKIKINMKDIYEFLYMHYTYPNLEIKEQKLIKDSFFANKNISLNNSSTVLKYLSKIDKKNDKNIKKYINSFLYHNNL